MRFDIARLKINQAIGADTEIEVIWDLQDRKNLYGKWIVFYGAKIIFKGVRIKTLPDFCDLDELVEEIVRIVKDIKEGGVNYLEAFSG